MLDMRNQMKNFLCLLITVFCALLVPQADAFFHSKNFALSIYSQPYFLHINFFGAISLNIVAILFCQYSYSEYFQELMHNLKAKNRQLEEKESALSKSLEQLRTSQLELNNSYDLLKEKQGQLQALAGNVPGVIFNMEILQNAIISFKYISSRAYEFFEFDEIDIMLNANLVLDQIMPEFRKDVYVDLLSNHKEDTQIAPEIKILTPKGHEKWLKAEMFISPIQEGKKQINGVFLDITEEKKQVASRERMQKSLLNIPNENCIISGDIVNAMKLITNTAKETLEVNSVSIWLLDKEKTPQLQCQEHTSDKEYDYARDPINLSEIELFRSTLEKDKVVVADDAHTHPITQELYAKNLRPHFIKSTLDADIILKGAIQGIISCEHSSERHWEQDEVQYINSLSDIISLALEIHERKKTESEIQRAYSLIISVFDAVEEGLMVVGSDNETLECNNRFIEMFRVPPPLLNKENRRLRIRYIADQLVNGDDFMEKLYAVEASNEHKFFDVLHLRDKRAIEQFSQPFYVQGKFMGRIWSYRDITKRLQAEESLRTVNSELDTFIYRASHDIKGPLARLRGICDVAKMTVNDEQANVYLQLLDQESKKLDSILGKLLVVKDLKTNNIKIEKINFNEVLDKSLKYLKYVQDFENINIKVQVDNTLEFQSDENLLELVFMNLIDNAIQFRDENKPSTNILVDIYPENNFVTVRIKDNGIGMEETIVNQIFDMHFRGNERSTGTGLGLYIVKTAVDALNGKIYVQSKISEGTDFIFSLPNKMLSKSLMV
jgi:signal transduction histidine kinase